MTTTPEHESPYLDWLDPEAIKTPNHANLQDYDDVLTASFRDFGQIEPILVAQTPSGLTLISGARRLRAALALERKVYALITPYEDNDLLALTLELRAQTRAPSFIETAKMAGRAAEMGLSKFEICQMLKIDHPQLSRLLFVINTLPAQWVEVIGSAAGIGRERWLRLAQMVSELGVPEGQSLQFEIRIPPNSDARFETLFAAILKEYQEEKARQKRLQIGEGSRKRGAIFGLAREPLGWVEGFARKLVFSFPKKSMGGFVDFLLENMPELHNAYKLRVFEGFYLGDRAQNLGKDWGENPRHNGVNPAKLSADNGGFPDPKTRAETWPPNQAENGGSTP